MTENEFSQLFMRYMLARVPSMSLLLSRYPTQSDEPSEPTRADIISGWFDSLKDCKLDDAKRAVRELTSGKIECPRYAEEYPPAIARLSRSHSNERFVEDRKRIEQAHREKTYRCHYCLDSSVVWRWSEETIAVAEREPEAFISGAASVSPNKPDAVAGRCRCVGGRCFDPDRHFLCTGKLKSDRAELVEKLGKLDIPRSQGEWEFE